MTRAADLDQFLEELHQDVLTRASLEGEEKLLPTAFTERVLEDLVAIGEVDDGEACYLTGPGYEVSGYNLNEEEGLLDLFITRYSGSQRAERISPATLNTAINNALAFYRSARTKLLGGLDPASPAFDMMLRIADAERVDRIRVHVLTDALTRDVGRQSEERDGSLVSYHTWDLERLQKLAVSGVHPEPLNVDIRAFGQFEVPCIEAPSNSGDYRAYLAIFPGELLAHLYTTYGPRLLELNVRSYLQARGKVNAGMRRTILDEPEHFLAFNNGISVTAATVSVERGVSGSMVVTEIHDMQIVNGGQTTAAIATAWRRDKADISALSVAAKITVVPSHLIDAFVPFISRYANSQNKVNEADFAANDPFHVSVEKMSRSTWAPAPEGTQRMTKWFYERARGQYADALARQETLPRRNQFKIEWPPAQKFTKTDLAKFENSWEQYPHLVSRGAEKNFREFAITRGRQRGPVDEAEFHGIVARAILFRSTEKIVSALGLVGYRANVVAYSVAYLAHVTESRIDLSAIWRSQALQESVARALREIAPAVYKEITEPPGGGNAGEWSKREKCWESIRGLDVKLPDMSGALASVQRPSRPGSSPTSDDDAAVVAAIKAVDADIWFSIAHWARETNNLASWQRSIAFSLGRLAQSRTTPSVKQAAQGAVILNEVQRLGFKFQAVEPKDRG